MMILKPIYLLNQRFIPAILMSGQKQKILNLLIQFWKSVFIKFYSKIYRNSLASSSIQIKLVSFFPLFQAIIYPPDRNSLRFFRSFLPELPTRARAPPINLLIQPHLQFRSIWKLSLLSKMDISKTAWITPEVNLKTQSSLKNRH